MIFDKHANLKYKFGYRDFGAEGYYMSTVGQVKQRLKKTVIYGFISLRDISP